MSRASAILIAGPTTSGKSALALTLAEKLNGTIINADSMQVYSDLAIITARPGVEDQARVPHRLYGHVDASETYSVGRWCVDAAAAIAEARRDDRLPMLVGGTGLYFKALTRGLAAVPPIPADVRATIRARLSSEGLAPLYADLVRLDPAAAHRLMPGDRSRITRALEVVMATGRSLTDWHREGMPPSIETEHAVKILLAQGALEEVRRLTARKLDPLLPAMKAHGVPWLIRHLNGEITLAEAAEGGKRDTRRYTKRQATWFRNQMPEWLWCSPAEAETAILEQIHQPRT